MRRLLFLVVLLSLLAACGGGGNAVPPPLPTTPPLPPAPVNVDESEIVPTVVVENANKVEVPGRLLFVRNEPRGTGNGATGNIWLVAGDSTRRVTSSGKKYHAAWSPDGSRIAYIQREESFADVWVMNPNAADKIQITNNEPSGIDARSEEHILSVKWAFYPRWSNDGSVLAYVSQLTPPEFVTSEVPREYPLSLYLYGSRRIDEGTIADASFQRLVKPDTDLSHPTWATDDSLLVYTQVERCYGNSCTDGAMQLGFYVPETDLAGVVQGDDAEVFIDAMDAAFSPDGKWLAYIKRDGNTSDVWVVRAPGIDGVASGTPVKLTTAERVRMPTWSPDSRKLAYFIAKDNLVSLTISDVTTTNGKLSLANPVEVQKDTLDIDSGMSWVR